MFAIIKQKLSTNSFISDSLSLSLANIINSALSYFFLICAAFILNADEFGILGAAVGILTLLTMVGNVAQLQVTSLVAASEKNESAKGLAAFYAKQIGVYLIIPIALLLIFSSQIGSLINCGAIEIILLSLAFLVLLVSCIANGITSGLCLLKLQAKAGMFSALAKFVFGIILIFIGCGAAGGIIAYIIGYAVVIYFSLTQQRIPEDKLLNKFKPAELSATSTLWGLAAVYSLLICPFVLDQLLVQHHNPAIGGAYTALGILGKLVFFISAPILSVVYSHACSAKTSADQIRIFKHGSLGLIAIIVAAILGWLTLGPALGPILLPSQYDYVLPQVLFFCLGISMYSITYLLALFALVKNNYKIILALTPAVPAQFLLFFFRHASVEQAVVNQFIVFALQLLCVLAFLISTKLNANPET